MHQTHSKYNQNKSNTYIQTVNLNIHIQQTINHNQTGSKLLLLANTPEADGFKTSNELIHFTTIILPILMFYAPHTYRANLTCNKLFMNVLR